MKDFLALYVAISIERDIMSGGINEISEVKHSISK